MWGPALLLGVLCLNSDKRQRRETRAGQNEQKRYKGLIRALKWIRKELLSVSLNKVRVKNDNETSLFKLQEAEINIFELLLAKKSAFFQFSDKLRKSFTC